MFGFFNVWKDEAKDAEKKLVSEIDVHCLGTHRNSVKREKKPYAQTDCYLMEAKQATAHSANAYA